MSVWLDNRELPETRSAGCTWRPRVRWCEDETASDEEFIAQATPTNTELLHWAAKPTSQPPQEWWDDTTDPFSPEDD